jgi:uncharacterized membrane protein
MSAAPPAASAISNPSPATRLWRLDALRGLAIVAMIVFHFAWDLSQLGFIATEVAQHPGWRAFSHAIAASFLAIAGFSLVKAHGASFRPAHFQRRLLIVAGAALLVTGGTFVAFPDRYVTFGILHAIAAGSVLTLPFLRRPWWWAAAAALAVLGAEQWSQGATSSPVQSFVAGSALEGVWRHLGLAWSDPPTVDFVPIFPWFAALLAGVALGRLHHRHAAAPVAPQAPPRAARPLMLLGRWSLPIYLVHQPILFGGLMGLAALAPQLTIGHAQRLDLRFATDCVMQCRATASRETCDQGCACVLNGLKADPALHRRVILEGRDDPQTNAAFQGVVAACRRAP